jgi:hypothetical protein
LPASVAVAAVGDIPGVRFKVVIVKLVLQGLRSSAASRRSLAHIFLMFDAEPVTNSSPQF